MIFSVHISERSAYGHDEWRDHPFETVEEAIAFATEEVNDWEASNFWFDHERRIWVRWSTETDFPDFRTIGVYHGEEPVDWQPDQQK